MTQVDTNEKSGGNTSNPRYRNWFFTINNFDEKDEKNMELELEKSDRGSWQVEAGENDTRHIQGCLCYRNARTFQSLKKKFPKAHLEKVMNVEDALLYCAKEDTRISGPHTKGLYRRSKISGRLRLWQCILKKYLSTEPDSRKIIWITDKTGNTGKTALCKDLVLTMDALYLTGNSKDMKYGVKNYIENRKKIPKIILMDLTRSQQNHLSYHGLEQIKNGIFFNEKYESGMCIYEEPHVIIMANFRPQLERLSLDRWRVMKI